jgi:hypothetical protein
MPKVMLAPPASPWKFLELAPAKGDATINFQVILTYLIKPC